MPLLHEGQECCESELQLALGWVRNAQTCGFRVLGTFVLLVDGRDVCQRGAQRFHLR